MKDKNTVWMPYEEYVAFKKLEEEMTPILRMKMGYFFWNNFSYDGFDEWYKKYKDVQDKGKEEE
jgi:hypothetical protein